VTLAFAGDVHFAGRLESGLQDPAQALASIEPYLSAADVTVLNLETAITDRGRPEPKTFHFRAPASALDALDAAGVDVVTMANNHGVDYGRQGLEDSLAAKADSPIPVVGIGHDADEAFAPAVIDVRGTKVAVIGATQVPDHTAAAWPARDGRAGVAVALNPDRLVAAVKAARKSADVVVVYLHWGTERQGCPDAGQQRVTPKLVAAGADVVVGTHAHRLLGSGWWSGKPGTAYVNYGLGNFVWWRSNGENAVTTGVLTLELDGRDVASADWLPMRIGDDGIPAPVPEPAAGRAVAAWEKTRQCTDLDGAPGGS
jgi:poly-gamma-glutamate synthesis protein (capsule biosynthesis protein)